MATRVGESAGEAKRYVPPEGSGDAAARIERAEEETKRQGREKGLAEGREEAFREVQGRIEGLASCLETLTRLRGELVLRAERDILRLAVKIAEVIVRDRVATDGEVALRSLRAGLEQVPAGEKFTVRCHPEDRQLLETWLKRSSAGVEHYLEDDQALTPGGCVVTCEAGEIDVRVETQLKIIEHELLERS